AGGIIVVQDPETAEMPYMPVSAIDKITPDYIYKPQQLLEFINFL
ncbi:MAG: chemotaxis protein CheB, partial [Bacteroidota bacterium]